MAHQAANGVLCLFLGACNISALRAAHPDEPRAHHGGSPWFTSCDNDLVTMVISIVISMGISHYQHHEFGSSKGNPKASWALSLRLGLANHYGSCSGCVVIVAIIQTYWICNL